MKNNTCQDMFHKCFQTLWAMQTLHNINRNHDLNLMGNVGWFLCNYNKYFACVEPAESLRKKHVSAIIHAFRNFVLPSKVNPTTRLKIELGSCVSDHICLVRKADKASQLMCWPRSLCSSMLYTSNGFVGIDTKRVQFAITSRKQKLQSSVKHTKKQHNLKQATAPSIGRLAVQKL